MATKIEWCMNKDGTKGTTLNVTTGCDPISDGCLHCYARIMTKRLQAMGIPKYKNGFKLTEHPAELEKPYKWKKPRTIFLNSMSDLFHKDVSDAFIFKVFNMIYDNPQHTFIILTKRSERLLKLNERLHWPDNLWMGVSMSRGTQIITATRLYLTNAKTKFISYEPLLGDPLSANYYSGVTGSRLAPIHDRGLQVLHGMDWIIAGGETGPGARLVKPEWIYALREFCKESKIPFFFKGWGTAMMKKKNPLYKLLAGREYNEMPKVIK